MAIDNLKAQIQRLPEQPGVYIFSNPAGETIYVGKARTLRDRVRSYLGPPAGPKTAALQDEASALEVVVTDSVVEALALENHLIKQRAPRYNILLRDDKNYPYLQLTTGEAFPRLLVARRVERDGHVYAGPFLPASLARRTMSLVHKIFGVRSCNEVITGQRSRPCLEYDIKRCAAPCVEALCPPTAYALAVDDARLFLEGRTDELIAHLSERMHAAAEAERFEEAAQHRDALRTLHTLRDRHQKIASVRSGDRDVFAAKVGPAGAIVQVFIVRGGKVVDRVELVAPARQEGQDDAADVIEAAVGQFYEDHEPPNEVHLERTIDAAEVLEDYLSARSSRRVQVMVPQRGDKRALIELAARNAALAYENRFNRGGVAHFDALDTLRVALSLPTLPHRIECFDISTLQGSETVASMVVCEDGRMRRGEYRKFRIRGDLSYRTPHAHARPAQAAPAAPASSSASTPGVPLDRVLDDFQSMYEVVLRRYQRVLEAGGPFPDLIVIDGGAGQLSAAYAALEAVGLENLVAVGLAKKEELVVTRDSAAPLRWATSHPALLLLQRIRDEAHRFAVTFHRRARARRDLRSELDDVAGVGPRRRRALLKAFGSLAGVRRATREELAAVVGRQAASAVLGYFGDR